MATPSSSDGVRVMCERLQAVVAAEAAVQSEDLFALRDVNRILEARYATLVDRTSTLHSGMANLHGRLSSLQPHLAELSAVEGAVKSLEDAIGDLDVYTRSLEAELK
eukprot:TRINITY_DN36716_c0_g1_i1.p1 TRINITY_DN36716_c0_g1~~TRINITY_DN36716_c0_g1_i1.p1  ORF type:complete len:115 (-),score=11.59 TRINITY_DN36716_c0_g1_i1:178-498(-)